MPLILKTYRHLPITPLLIISFFLALLAISMDSKAANPKAAVVGENAKRIYDVLDDSLKKKGKSPTNLGEPLVYTKKLSGLSCASYTRMSWVASGNSKGPRGKWVRASTYTCELREDLSEKQIKEIYENLKVVELKDDSRIGAVTREKTVGILALKAVRAVIPGAKDQFSLTLITKGKDQTESEDMDMTLVITGKKAEDLYNSLNVKPDLKANSNNIDPTYVKTVGTLSCEHFYPHYAAEKYSCTIKGKRK